MCLTLLCQLPQTLVHGAVLFLNLLTLPQQQPLVLTKHSLPPTKGMVQEIRLICMLATKVVVSVFGVESVCQRGPPKQNEPGSAMVQQQCIGSAVKGIDSAKEKVPPCPTAVNFSQKKVLEFFFFLKKKFFFPNFWFMKNGMYTQKNTLLGKETWFSFGHGIQIGDAKALAL